MKNKNCIYRIGGANTEKTCFTPGNLYNVDASLPQCRILVDKGVPDKRCYNPDCNEEDCQLSPIAERQDQQ